MRRLHNVIRDYAWGSHTALAQLQGRPAPTSGPEAELWMGAHPAAPSQVVGDGPLTEVIAADPTAVLGPANTARFGHRLPYLLKLLAAAQPLSLQVHPNADQARAGYAAEEAAGVAVDAFTRNYPDPSHKPELLVALGEFEALCGFRDPVLTAAQLEALDLAALAPLIGVLRLEPAEQALRFAVSMLMSWPESERAELVKSVGVRAGAPAAALAVGYPSDIGVVMALLLNHVRLRPGDGLYLPAGNIHAYLNGLGVEVMAASDNVLRCGLTPKHVDVDESLRVLTYDVLVDPVVRPVSLTPAIRTWPVPVDDFCLYEATLDASSQSDHAAQSEHAAQSNHAAITMPGAGPRVLTCVRGTAEVRVGAQALTLGAGEAVFLPASDPAAVLNGVDAVVYQAAPGGN